MMRMQRVGNKSDGCIDGMRLDADVPGNGCHVLLKASKVICQTQYLRLEEADAIVSLTKCSGHMCGCECVGSMLLRFDGFRDPIAFLDGDAILLFETVDA